MEYNCEYYWVSQYSFYYSKGVFDLVLSKMILGAFLKEKYYQWWDLPKQVQPWYLIAKHIKLSSHKVKLALVIEIFQHKLQEQWAFLSLQFTWLDPPELQEGWFWPYNSIHLRVHYLLQQTEAQHLLNWLPWLLHWNKKFQYYVYLCILENIRS